MDIQDSASIPSGEDLGKDNNQRLKNFDFNFRDPNSIEDESTFPIEIFPQLIQEYILDINRNLKFPKEFLAAGVLFASSVLIGNKFVVEIKQGYIEKAILYLAIIGRPGISKTPSLTHVLKPLKQLDSDNYKIYEKEIKKYNSDNKKDSEFKKNSNFYEQEKPIWKQLLISDFTPEALTRILQYNPEGIGVYVDELASWYKNFNRYNSGSDEQFWLSNWSGISITVNRVSKDDIHIQYPFISVCGTIQPLVLKDLANNRLNNGFMDRMLFLYPQHLKKEKLDFEYNETSLEPEWCKICNFIYNQQYFGEPKTLTFSKTAIKLMEEWQNNNTDKANETDKDLVMGLHSKMQSHCFRFALILHVLECACNDKWIEEISDKTAFAATKLAEYFIDESKKVYQVVTNYNPLDLLDRIHNNIYSILPKNFATSELVLICDANGLKERAAKSWIKNTQLFKKISHGNYTKLC